MHEADLDRILARGNIDDLDNLLATAESAADEAELMAKLESGDTGKADGEPKGDEPAGEPSADAAGNAPTQDTPTQEQPPQGDEPTPVIRAKDGKHEIPYSVLEQERQEKAELKRQFDELNRKAELLTSQLVAANIQPKDLPENIRFTKEQLAEAESFGTIGEMVAILAQQNEVLMQRLAAATAAPQLEPQQSDEPHPPAVIAANPELAQWWRNDPGRWNTAEAIDGALQNDPAWAGKDLSARIPEIVRRTKLAFGEAAGDRPTAADLARRADEALAGAQPRIPSSLTDVGGEVPGSQKPIVEQIQDLSEDDLAAFLEKQSRATGKSMDELLAQYATL